MIGKLFLTTLALVTIAPRLNGQLQETAVVGIYDVSTYSHGITPVLDAMKLPWRKITEQELKTPAVLKTFKAVAVIQGYTNRDDPLPNEVQEALTEYVDGGGRLYCEFRARPPNKVTGLSGYGEGPLGDLKVLSTDHPITRNLKEAQIIEYSLYGTGASTERSTATKLLGTTKSGCALIVNEDAGVCVYSGAILGAKNMNNTGERAMKQLISNIFAFLAEAPAFSFAVDTSQIETRLIGPADETRYALDEQGFVRNWIVTGPFLPNPTQNQNSENLFAADFLKPSDAAAKPVAGESAGTMVRWQEAGATKGINSDSPALDLRKAYPGDNRFAYASCCLDNPVARKLRFKVGSDDGFRMWVNGKLIGEVRQARAAFPDQNVYEVVLPPGRNTVLFKVENMVGGFELYLRITDLNDKAAQSLTPVILRNPVEIAKVKGDSSGPAMEFDPAAQVVDLGKTAVAIFREPRFPYSAMPERVTPERIAEACGSVGMRSEFLSAAELANASGLSTTRVHTLVMTYGETFPLDALGTIRGFLAAGGRLVCPAGAPFSHPVIRQADGWHDDGYTGAICDMVFRKMLPFAWAYGAERPVECAVVMTPDLLPGLPVRWPLTGGTVGFIPKVKDPAGIPFSIGANRKVVVGVSADGEVVTTPIWLLDNNPRVLLIGFTGKSHPWNPDAWGHWKQAIAGCLKLVAQPAVLAIRDIRPYECSYRSGETVKVDAVIRCTSGPVQGAMVQLQIRERDTGQRVFTSSQTADFAPGEEKPLTFEWPQAKLTTWAYEALVSAGAQNGPQATDTEMFTVWNDNTIQKAPVLTMKNGIAHLDGKPARLDGVNLYLDDERALALYWGGRPKFADGESRYKLTLALRDLHLGYLAALGCNSVRESYYGSRLTPDDFKGKETNALRAADSFFMLCAGNRFVNQCGPDVVVANDLFGNTASSPYWRPKFEAARTPEIRKALFAELNRYCGTFATRYQGFRNILWELQNEPDGPDLPTETERRAQHKALVPYLTDKRDRIKQGYGGGIFGIQNTTVDHNASWDRRALRDILDWSAVHTYTSACASERSRHHWAFAWNFGRPVTAGEVGFCKAPALEQLQHYILAEGGLGYTHFYLFEPPWANPGSGLGREDETEKPITKPFRRYMALQQILRADHFLPPNSVLVYNFEQRMRDPSSFDRFTETYIDLLRLGIHPWIVEESELTALPDHARFVFWPSEVTISDPTKKKLEEMVKAGRIKCLALGSSENSPPDWVSKDDPVKLLVKSLPVGIETGEPDVVYLLPDRSGGHTVILLNHKGDRQVTVRAGSHRIEINVPPEHAGTLSFNKQNDLVLAEARGDLTLDGKPLIHAPSEMPYLVAADDGLALANSRHLLIWAEPQNAVRVQNTTANYIANLNQVAIIYPAQEAYTTAASLIREGLQRLGVKASLARANEVAESNLSKNNLVLVGDALANQWARRFTGMLTVQGCSPARFVDLGAAQLKLPYSGAIKVVANPWNPKMSAILIQGVNPSATVLAAQNFTSLQLLDNYTVGPWARVSNE